MRYEINIKKTVERLDKYVIEVISQEEGDKIVEQFRRFCTIDKAKNHDDIVNGIRSTGSELIELVQGEEISFYKIKQEISNISERIKLLREEHNITQDYLAREVNVSRVSINNYESGKRVPNIETVLNIAKYFEVSADYLIGISNYSGGNITEEKSI